jgi:hypothetical protein
LGNGILIINVTQITFPLIVKFNACQILPCGDHMSQLQLQGYFLYMYHIPRPIGKPGIYLEWTDVGWNTGYKENTSPFYENPKGQTRPQGTGKTDFHHTK